MTPLVKALLAVALIVPMAAYVTGSLVASGAPTPERQEPVILQDAQAPGTESSQPDETSVPATSSTPAPPTPKPAPRNNAPEGQGGEPEDERVRVVTPQPTPVIDDDEDDEDDTDDDRETTDD